VKSNQKSEEKLPTLISPDEEKNLARELLDSETFRQNFSVIDGLTEFLLSVSEKFANRKWPIAVSDVFLRLVLSLLPLEDFYRIRHLIKTVWQITFSDIN